MPVTNQIPVLRPMTPHSPLAVPGVPPHQFSSISSITPQIPQPELTRQPYFEMPAGIMTQNIKLEDFDYSSINPNEMRIPLVTPPTERLLKALETFYAPPSHEHPRNADGWEKLALYEFFKQKSNARKEYETKYGPIEPNNDDQNDLKDFKNSSNGLNDKLIEDNKGDSKRSLSPPKRRFKEFKEEKEPGSGYD